MNKFSRIAITSMMLSAISAPVSATFLQDWYFDPDGSGGGRAPVLISEYLDFIGTSFIQNTFSNPTDFTFVDNGAFNINGHDGGSSLGLSNPQGGAPSVEITALFQNGTGVGSTTSAGILFTGGTVTFYSDPLVNFGTATTPPGPAIFGANDGTQIGAFTITGGNGLIDPVTTLPNGFLSIFLTATSLAPGYWFGPNMVDLSTTIGNGGFVLGFATTNGTYVANPSTTVKSQIVQALSGFDPSAPNFNQVPSNFVVGNNGQYRLQVPEPGSLALLGAGLIGLFGVSRRSKKFRLIRT